MKYRNVKNGLVATFVEHDDKCKTTMLELEDGSTKVLSDTTVKRWWKKVDEEDEYVQEVMQQKKELGIECPPIESYEVVSENEEKASDGTPYTQVMAEIQEGAKQKAKAVKQQKKVTVPLQDSFNKVVAVLKDAGLYIKRYATQPKTVSVTHDPTGKKSFCSIYLGGSKCVLCIKASDVPEEYVPDRIRNCPLSAAFDVAYDNLDKIIDIINNINTTKEEK